MSKRQPTANTGKRLDRYRIEKELGRGGMGVVYLAQDENLGRMVALKTTSVAGLGSGQDARNQRRARFIREVKALAQVSHENVVHVFDTGEADDPDLGWLLFYTMEYVEGITLAQLVHQQGALDPGAAAAVCMQVAAGLGAAHLQGIVHRDVKPANIFLAKDGRALIGDFGICKIEGSTQITRRDQLVGTPNYLAPEQILGEEISAATDVFALGALFYVIATNSPLRERTDAASLLKEASTNDPAKKVLADKRFPDGLRRVIGKALDRDPKKRYPDGAALADALSDHATRIPPLDTTRAPTKSAAAPVNLDTGTNPFAPMPGSASPADNFSGTGAGGIEEVAKALLQGFGGDDAPAKKGEPAAKPALPVARTESTVMFNIRQMEEEEERKKPALPVALTEPSGPMDRPSAELDDDTADPLPDAPSPSPDVPSSGQGLARHLDEATDTTTRTKPTAVVNVKTFDPNALKDGAGFPGWMYLAASAFVGFLLALSIVLVVRAIAAPDDDASDDAAPTTAAPVVDDSVRSLPASCAGKAKGERERKNAVAQVEKAKTAFQTFKRDEALAFVDKAIQLDPRNADAHFIRAQILAEDKARLDESREAYRCVVELVPGSLPAESAAQALKRQGQ